MSYPGSKAQAGRGTTISIGATPTEIGEVSDLPISRGKWETADVTNFDSGSDAEFIATIRKVGTVTIKGNRVAADAGQVLVETAYQDGSLQPFTVQLPKITGQVTNGDKYTFSALILGCDFSISPTKQIEFSIDLQISGATTFVAGA